MSDRPRVKITDVPHRAKCRVNEYDFREEAPLSACSCGAIIDLYESILQAIFDPENQPSQYGTEFAEGPDASWIK